MQGVQNDSNKRLLINDIHIIPAKNNILDKRNILNCIPESVDHKNISKDNFIIQNNSNIEEISKPKFKFLRDIEDCFNSECSSELEDN